jgi:hypothetical protein
VAGAIMTVEPKAGKPHPPSQFAMLAMANILGGLSITDDLGRFRLAGLAPGEYVVVATLQATGQMGLGASADFKKLSAISPLVVYAPEAFHRAEAKPVAVQGADDRRDVAVTLRLGGLHTVSGRVESAEDRHGINSGGVRLTDAKDPDFTRSASVDATGNYTLRFVPAGTYTLSIMGAQDTEAGKATAKPNLFGPPEKVLRSYVAGKRDVIVTDTNLTGQDFDLALDKNPASPSDALQKALKSLTPDEDKP